VVLKNKKINFNNITHYRKHGVPIEMGLVEQHGVGVRGVALCGVRSIGYIGKKKSNWA